MDAKTFVDHYLTSRKGTLSQKWDYLGEKFGRNDLLPLWIADMEFRTCDAVTEALTERVQHGIYGYSFVPDSYYEALDTWMKKRHGLSIPKEWVRFSTGCVTGIAWSMAAFTKPGDACMILTPVYYPFHNVVTNNHRKLVKVPLHYDNGYATMDYERIEKAIVDNDVKMFIQCSPQNPMGRVFTEDELDRVLDICMRHHVLVVSDEIHQDIIIGDHPFVPAAAVKGGKYRDILITLNSATKSFNLATLLHSHIIISNPELRKKYDEFAGGMNRTEVSIMGMLATQAAYENGAEWLDGLLSVIRENDKTLREGLKQSLPKAVVCALEGTYLVMVDLRAYIEPGKTKEVIQNQCRLAVDYGEWFGDGFEGFIRLNLATDPKLIKEVVQRLASVLGK
jgi:cystathionine beta-lyase